MVTPDTARISVNFEELELVYGKAEQVTTRTGAFTRVGPGAVCDDLTSFGGCSVVIVFLMDYREEAEIHSRPDPDLKYIASIAFLFSGSNA
jgi:hypothetical protein